ncbi:sporulation protein YtxC [Amphibacillus jilinensis]|uniref:sporulation protein YtxC n=1 Tax=Amphibacillus jilinensis TaxID=1216008 RepID=UPI0002D6E263|nr:sporulation protein YtxC [Amphibacillus jilinensis]
MVKVKFNDKIDQHVLRNRLYHQQVLWRSISDDEVEIFEHDCERVSTWLAELFFYFDLKPILKERLIQDYHYYDFNEIDAILTIAAQLLLTDHYQNVSFLKDLRETMLHYFTLTPEQQCYHYFDQSQLFFKQADWLIDEVLGRAIDEKKQDEQYQIFLQSLREYVQKQPLGDSCFVKWDDDRIRFFEKSGNCYSNETLNNLIKDTPIHIYQFAKNEYQISPLLALNPRKIYIYTNKVDDPILETLQNIFDERVKIFEKNTFPFSFQQ